MFVTQKSFANGRFNPVQIQNKDYEKGFWETAEDAFDYSAYTDLSIARQNNLHQEFEDVVETVKQKTGVQLNNPLRDGYSEFAWDFTKMASKRLFGGGHKELLNLIYPNNKEKEQNRSIEEFYKQVDALQHEYPQLNVPTLQDIQNRIKDKAKQKYFNVNDGRSASVLGSFVGASTALMTDPINITAMLMTAGTGEAATATLSAAVSGTARSGAASFAKGLARTAVYEAGTNALTEAFIQPSVYQYKNELGLDYSVGEAVSNVAAAGIGGAVLGTAFKTAGSVSAKVLEKFRNAKAAGLKISPRVEAAAEILNEKLLLDARLEESNPYVDSLTGRALHEEKFKAEYRRLLNEQEAVGRAYDEVKLRPIGDKSDPLVVLRPEDMEEVHVERGEYRPKNRTGYGLLKIEWKHGELGSDAIPVMRDDIVQFPKIIREYEPIDNHGYGNHRTWSVRRKDGAQVIYADAKFAEDQTRHLVSIYVVDPRTKKGSELAGIFSKKKSSQSRTKDFRSLASDTTERTFGRPSRSESIDNIIHPKQEKVNIESNSGKFNRDEFMNWLKESEVPEPKEATRKLQTDNTFVAEELNKRLEIEDFEIPIQEIDGQVITKSARELLAEYENYGRYIDEIKSCVTEFIK